MHNYSVGRNNIFLIKKQYTKELLTNYLSTRCYLNTTKTFSWPKGSKIKACSLPDAGLLGSRMLPEHNKLFSWPKGSKIKVCPLPDAGLLGSRMLPEYNTFFLGLMVVK